MKKLILIALFFPFIISSQNLQVANGATLLIDTGGSMTVTGSIGSNTTGNIIVVTSRTASGSLIAKAGGASQGKGITLRRQLDNNEWALIGVPVTGEVVDDIDGQLLSGSGSQNGKVSLGVFDPAAEAYSYFTAGSNTALIAGKGYSIRPSGAVSIDFTGTMSVSSVYYDLVDEDGTYGNWNLIGNPYPSYLNMTDDSGEATHNFLTQNAAAIHDSYEAVYAWDGSEFDVYNHTSNSINHIAPGEGFFVYAVNGAATNAKFSEDMQTSGKGVNFNASRISDDSKKNSFVKIELQDNVNNGTDRLKLYFGDNVSRGLDPGYDAGKFSFGGSSSKVFTRLVEDDEGIDFQIQALPYNDLKDVVIPLGITTNSSSLKLSIKENTIDHLYNLYLEDRQKNTIVEFDKDIEVNFDENSDGIGRFYLHFTDGMIPELPTDGDDFRIFKVSNSEIRLMGDPDNFYNVKVYDFSGRLLRDVNFKHRVNIDEINSKEINILSIQSEKKKLIKKFKIK